MNFYLSIKIKEIYNVRLNREIMNVGQLPKQNSLKAFHLDEMVKIILGAQELGVRPCRNTKIKLK